MELRSAARTDVGRKRKHNEDAFLVDDALGFFVVADGMGGHAAGEVASREAVEAAHGMVRRAQGELDRYLAARNEASRTALRRVLEGAIQAATYMVFGIAEQDPEHRGMGTTITALLIVGDLAVVGSVGDSRAYLLRDEHCWQVTEDHTLVQLQMKAGMLTPEEAKNSRRGNVITRAVGPREYVQVDVFLLPVEPADRYVLCSDGLHGYFQGVEEVRGIAGAGPLDAACEEFVALANDRGGKDNITVVAVEVLDNKAR